MKRFKIIYSNKRYSVKRDGTGWAWIIVDVDKETLKVVCDISEELFIEIKKRNFDGLLQTSKYGKLQIFEHDKGKYEDL